MTSSSFLFVVRVPVEEDDVNVNNIDSKDTVGNDDPVKQEGLREGLDSNNERSTETTSNGKSDKVQSASIPRSSDADDDGSTSVKHIEPEKQNDETGDTASTSDPSSKISESISKATSDVSTTPEQTNSPKRTSNTSSPETSDPLKIVTSDPSVSDEDGDMPTPPPWDFTPPSSPTSTSALHNADEVQLHDNDPKDSNPLPEKDLPSPAWAFPPSDKLDEKSPAVQSTADISAKESDSSSEQPKPLQSPEVSTISQSGAQPTPLNTPDPLSNSTSSAQGISDGITVENEDVNNKMEENEEKAQLTGDESNDHTPKSRESDTEKGSNNEKSKNSEISVKTEKDSDKDNDNLEIFVKKETMFQRTMSVLESYSVKNLSVHKTSSSKYYQFMFVEEGENCEEILNKLAEIGIGDNNQSSISIFETSIYKGTGGVIEEEEYEEDLYNSVANTDEQKQSEFKKSIKARMLVTEVVNSVQGNAEFTFDFLVLILLASSISAMGLVENSSVVLVASMLVSPIMGPILAGTFGTVIKNNTLRNLGIKNEVLSLLICIGMGLVWGLVFGGVCKDGAFWGSTHEWPTSEMKSRGLTRSLWTGILIALPSGAGVALSILGGNTGSLVGVAISASLLPPAVNAGMLWASAIIASIDPPPRVQITSTTPPIPTVQNYTVYNITDSNSTVTELPASPTLTPGLSCVPFDNNAYVPVYSCDMAEEMLYLGLFSLLLTILNIICIIIMGIFVLKIKEVAPQMALSEETKDFWREDIKIAKASYVTMKGNQSKNLSQQARDLLNEWRKENGDQPIQLLQLERMTQEIDDDPAVHEIQMRIPGGVRGDLVSRHFADHINKDEEEDIDIVSPNYKTFHDFHYMYGHSRRNLFHTSYHPSPNSSTGSMRRKKYMQASLTEVDEKNVPHSADGPIKPTKPTSHFSKAFGILRHPKAGRSNLFRRRANDKKTEEKQLRFAVEKVPEEEVKVQLMKENDKQDVSLPLLERKESV
ncbi:uncharacterized protein LOC132553292 [Ylistrum balloti]|uniref:uncharacterized protein LOC132553292 n=1 Tax=Ylistrum balloti TaxID=509963 RepID=UPI002905E293|nr:uncharacterized protein LOC132553292 [Ylistrum balloti]